MTPHVSDVDMANGRMDNDKNTNYLLLRSHPCNSMMIHMVRFFGEFTLRNCFFVRSKRNEYLAFVKYVYTRLYGWKYLIDLSELVKISRNKFVLFIKQAKHVTIHSKQLLQNDAELFAFFSACLYFSCPLTISHYLPNRIYILRAYFLKCKLMLVHSPHFWFALCVCVCAFSVRHSKSLRKSWNSFPTAHRQRHAKDSGTYFANC